jgi:outer membrane protein assembly factor BamB
VSGLRISTVVSRETVSGHRWRPSGPSRHRVSVRGAALLLGLSLLGLLLFSACGRIATPQGWAAPVTADGTLIVTLQRAKLSAIDQQTYQERWRFPPGSATATPTSTAPAATASPTGPAASPTAAGTAASTGGPPCDLKNIDLKALYGTPAIGNGRVYVGAFSGIFYALDLAGVCIWQQETGGAIIGGATLADGTVYVGSSDNKLYAFDAASGASRWTPFEAQGDIWSMPIVDQGTVYITSMDKRVYAVDAATGQAKWPKPFEADGAIASTPALAGDKLYVGALDNRLYALDKATGEVAWSFKAGNWIWCDPLVANGVVYVGGLDHHVYALDAATGEPRWPKAFAAKAPIRAQPVIAGGVLVVADEDGNVYGLDPTSGQERWPSIALTSGVLANPLVMDSEVLMSTRNWSLVKVDAQAGSFSQVLPAP